MSSNAQLAREKSASIILAIRNRSNGCTKFQDYPDPLLLFAEKCAATTCNDNRKVDLPLRTRSTFMTAFSPDHSLVASCHGDHNVHVTNVHTEKLVKSLVGHERSPWCISFHPSSSDILATGCLNGEVKVWDLRGGGSESWLAPVENATIASLSFHPSDQCLLIAAGCWIYFWDWSRPEPFASIKTSSIHEKVRLVRFDIWGNHILTGVVNDDEQLSGGEEDEDENDTGDWAVPPVRPPTNSTSHLSRRRRFLRDLLSNAPSGSTPTRSPASRPLTASHTLRSRRDARPPPTDTPSDQSTVGDRTDLFGLRNTTTSDRTHRSAGYFSRLPSTPPLEHTHSYSRDHERILHARVSVNAEIQHQYNRLQVLRLERRRLELRLQELRDRRNGDVSHARTGDPATLRPFVIATRQTSPPRPSSHRRLSAALHRRLADRRARRCEALVQGRPLHTPMRDGAGPTAGYANPVINMNPVSRAALRTSAILSFLPLEEPSEQQEASPAVPATGSQNFRIPPASFNDDLYRSALIRDSPLFPPPDIPPPPLDPATAFHRGIDLFLTANRSAADASESSSTTEPPLSRASSQPRYRVIQRAPHWRRNQRRARSINQFLSFMPGYSTPDPTSYRLQWWDFSKLELPEISRSDVNIIVPQCKIYNDSSVDISKDGRKLAAFIPADFSFHETMQVAVYSLEQNTLGQIVFRKQIGPNAVCLSLSPLSAYVAVGVKNRLYSLEGRHHQRSLMAQILKVGNKASGDNGSAVVNLLSHPVVSDTPHRIVNINTIAWLPSVGSGIIYGTNNGELRICRTKVTSTVE